ncbi:3'(2'),5'-bisphosphate nucleotidase CysQ family protein [Carboxylicivirga taeanensis]|uniref:3'(2'),5'-bisphosphate nucleotidase CysQ family protein n=1 Tax=Carboxylicivirga taeanensis TaxID=1416875 RepID=UPI003F6DDF16
MQLTQQHIEELASCAINAATQAGELIHQRSQEQFAVHQKAGGNSLASQVFTEVDLASEQLILNTLQASIEKYDLALLSEETADDHSRFEKDFFWCIDPLDGTLPFIEQTDGYSVSIALVDKQGHPHIGVIYNPVEATLYHAIKGQGAFKNQQPWTVHQQNEALTLVCDRSLTLHKDYNAIITQLKSFASGELNIISHGGAAMNAMWVLENSPAIYFKFPKKNDGGGSIWDFAASACIFNEIKASAASFNNDVLDLNRSDSTFMNHQGILYGSHHSLAIHCKRLLS